MSKHSRPSMAPRVIAVGAALGIVLGSGAGVGSIITADAAEAVRPAFTAPDRDDDPVRRIGPIAPIFPTDLAAPHYEPEPERPRIATESPRSVPTPTVGVSGPPVTVMGLVEAPAVTTEPTESHVSRCCDRDDETPTDTTAEPEAEPTEAATPLPEPDEDQPQEEPDVTGEPTEPEITDAVIEVLDPEPPDEVQP